MKTTQRPECLLYLHPAVVDRTLIESIQKKHRSFFAHQGPKDTHNQKSSALQSRPLGGDAA